jgi:acyl-coenzyme A thioesterase PaaI-like protein
MQGNAPKLLPSSQLKFIRVPFLSFTPDNSTSNPVYTMDSVKTHENINPELCGIPIQLSEGTSKVRLETNSEMSVDAKGLVHGGFIFGLADYAAMIAVNDPNVVLGSSEAVFKSPVRAGEILIAEAKLLKSENRKRKVEVSVKKEELEVFKGSFTCYVLEKHVLDR